MGAGGSSCDRCARSGVTGPRSTSSLTRRSTSSSILFLHAGRQICAASAERDGQAAVDDPDVVNICIDKIWQESVQRKNQRRRLLVAYQVGGQAVAHQAE